MNWLLAFAAIVVLIFVVIDLVATVTRPGGGGFLGQRVAAGFWNLGSAVHRRRPSHRMLSNVGIWSVVNITIFWMLALWFGWSLLYLSSDQAVLDATTMEPSDAWSRVYHAGYTLFTSGLGDRVPGSASWQVATVVTTMSGLALITLAVTFLISILQAATAKRAFARTVSHLGGSTDGLVARSWVQNGHLATIADQVATEVSSLTEKHLSYPVLEYLHSDTITTAFVPRVAALHDAMLVALHDADEDQQPGLEFALIALAGFAEVASAHRLTDLPDQAPPLPRSAPADSAQRFEHASGTRRRLSALVQHDGWSWSAVDGST